MNMKTLQVNKTDFSKILETAEILIAEIEKALSQNEIVMKRVAEIKTGKIKGRTENELNEYLKKRGAKVD